MKKVIVLMLMMTLFALPAMAKDPKVRDVGYGVYLQPMKYFFYVVDTKAQICLAKGTVHPSGMTNIDCKNLAKRDEWKSIITWVE